MKQIIMIKPNDENVTLEPIEFDLQEAKALLNLLAEQPDEMMNYRNVYYKLFYVIWFAENSTNTEIKKN